MILEFKGKVMLKNVVRSKSCLLYADQINCRHFYYNKESEVTANIRHPDSDRIIVHAFFFELSLKKDPVKLSGMI